MIHSRERLEFIDGHVRVSGPDGGMHRPDRRCEMILNAIKATGDAHLMLEPEDLLMLVLACEGMVNTMTTLRKMDLACAYETLGSYLGLIHDRAVKKRARWLAANPPPAR